MNKIINELLRDFVKVVWLLPFLLFASQHLEAQSSLATNYASAIEESGLYEHLLVLTQDSLDGRGAGTPGQLKAADYIKDQFKSANLKPLTEDNYFQEFPIYQESIEGVALQDDDSVYTHSVVYLGDKDIKDWQQLELVFIGNGKEEDVQKLDLEGKAVAFWESDYWRWRNRVSWGKEKGVAAYVTVLNADPEYLERVKNFTGRSRFHQEKPLKTDSTDHEIAFMISKEVAFRIFNADSADLDQFNRRKLLTTQIKVKAGKSVKELTMKNVVAVVPGAELEEEALIISAHYDHLGRRGTDIYPGADDNGSGVAAVLEIAESFSKAAAEGNPPLRTVIFMALSSEEIGLFGSEYYVNNPLFPLENTVANLNIDMVGRIDEVHQANPNYIYLIGSDKLSLDLHNLSEVTNETYTGLELDYTYNLDSDPNRYYYRSDHYNFAKNGIPVIFYFNGTHEDYHQPGDTFDKINFEIMAKRIRLIFYTAWAVANREERIKIDSEEQKIQRNLEK